MGYNPFGFSGRCIGDFCAGIHKDYQKESTWRNLVETFHSHHPTDDAVGHAEALLKMVEMTSINKAKLIEIKPSYNSDWLCPICKCMVFGSKSECKKCMSKRP